MMEDELFPRLVEDRLVEALADAPAVLVHGPRQCGKTTLAQRIGSKPGYTYFSFDDAVLLSAVREDPDGFVDNLPDRSILDEVQRAPEIFTALKRVIDRQRTPGRFLLTGSSNVLSELAEALTGRMEILRLYPLSQCELSSRQPRFLERLFSSSFNIRQFPKQGITLPEQIAAGGYPAALARSTPRRRTKWYRDYIEMLIRREVRDATRIRQPDLLPRLLGLVASGTAQLLNVSTLAAPFQTSQITIRSYLALLERMFLLESLPSWHSNRARRLIKTPKLHIGDTGLACALLNADAEALAADRTILGHMAETFVYQELRRHASGHQAVHRFHHFRDKDGIEVDIVIERGAHELAGVEVKAGATVTSKDFRGLRKLRAAAGERFACGVVLHGGELSVGFGDDLYAVPIRALDEV